MALNFANNNSLSAITTLPASISGGGMTLISEQTASSSATIDFTSGIDSTYDSYVFKFYNIHPSASGDGNKFQFNFSTDGGSNYNVTKTTTAIRVWHYENDSETGLDYHTGGDLAQSTNFQVITEGLNNDNDHGASGTMSLFNPSSTTFVKHFITETSSIRPGNINYRYMTAGYGNTTSSIDAVRFQISSGNIDSGVIKLYGIS
jgi:hypothetical protein